MFPSLFRTIYPSTTLKKLHRLEFLNSLISTVDKRFYFCFALFRMCIHLRKAEDSCSLCYKIGIIVIIIISSKRRSLTVSPSELFPLPRPTSFRKSSAPLHSEADCMRSPLTLTPYLFLLLNAALANKRILLWQLVKVVKVVVNLYPTCADCYCALASHFSRE